LAWLVWLEWRQWWSWWEYPGKNAILLWVVMAPLVLAGQAFGEVGVLDSLGWDSVDEVLIGLRSCSIVVVVCMPLEEP
jgi:hypothetical protein